MIIKIETYWNVNHSANVTFSRRYTIKIETYWNVNMLPQLVFLPLLLIKIETYWNVNSVPAAPCLHPADLNRDILER